MYVKLMVYPQIKYFRLNSLTFPFHSCTLNTKMFLSENTMEMVENHMKEGLSEWVYGYNEVLKEGLKWKYLCMIGLHMNHTLCHGSKILKTSIFHFNVSHYFT